MKSEYDDNSDVPEVGTEDEAQKSWLGNALSCLTGLVGGGTIPSVPPPAPQHTHFTTNVTAMATMAAQTATTQAYPYNTTLSYAHSHTNWQGLYGNAAAQQQQAVSHAHQMLAQQNPQQNLTLLGQANYTQASQAIGTLNTATAMPSNATYAVAHAPAPAPCRVIIAGSRGINDMRHINAAMAQAHLQGLYPTETLCGGASGPDKLGAIWAHGQGLRTTHYIPDWKNQGKAAGFIRNTRMAQNADALVAIWDGQSKGTWHMICEANKMGLPVLIWNLDTHTWVHTCYAGRAQVTAGMGPIIALEGQGDTNGEELMSSYTQALDAAPTQS